MRASLCLSSLLVASFVACGENPASQGPEMVELIEETRFSAMGIPPADDLMATVETLAGPEFRGRGSGTEDELRAARWLAKEFESRGLTADRGGFIKTFPQGYGKRDRSQNVIGILEGRDPKRRIILGAHYDHLGMIGGTIYPGADDNASGVAVMLAVADALAQRKEPLEHSIWFVGFGAEEIGKLGSSYFAATSRLPTSVMINLDMVGHPQLLAHPNYSAARPVLGDTPAVGLLSSARSPELSRLAKAGAGTVGLRAVAANDFPSFVEAKIRRLSERRGDHDSFRRVGIPYLWFSTSMSPHYHQHTDTKDTVDAGVMRSIAGAVFHTILAIDADKGSKLADAGDSSYSRFARRRAR